MADLTGLGSILEVGGKILDKVIPDPVARAQAQAALITAQNDAELKDLNARLSAIVAEASSADPWTSRARPTFMYVFYLVILMLVLVAPVIGVVFPAQMALFFANVKAGFNAIPTEMWGVFTAGFLGYAGFRTVEKVKGAA